MLISKRSVINLSKWPFIVSGVIQRERDLCERERVSGSCGTLCDTLAILRCQSTVASHECHDAEIFGSRTGGRCALVSLASNLLGNSIGMASNLRAMASNPIASNLDTLEAHMFNSTLYGLMFSCSTVLEKHRFLRGNTNLI